MGIWQIERFAWDCLCARKWISLLLYGFVSIWSKNLEFVLTFIGYYIHNCQKMRYKGNFKPQYILGKQVVRAWLLFFVMKWTFTDPYRPRIKHMGPPWRRTLSKTRYPTLRLSITRSLLEGRRISTRGTHRWHQRRGPFSIQNRHARCPDLGSSERIKLGELESSIPWSICSFQCEFKLCHLYGKITDPERTLSVGRKWSMIIHSLSKGLLVSLPLF